MACTVSQTDACERRHRLIAVGHTMIILRNHDIFNCRQIRNHVKLLKDNPDFITAITCQLLRRCIGQNRSVENDLPTRCTVHAAYDVHEC